MVDALERVRLLVAARLPTETVRPLLTPTLRRPGPFLTVFSSLLGSPLNGGPKTARQYWLRTGLNMRAHPIQSSRAARWKFPFLDFLDRGGGTLGLIALPCLGRWGSVVRIQYYEV